jgi:hypothetical protein
MPHQARNDVVAAGSRETDDQTYRPARMGVREGTASNGRRGDSTRRQMEKFPARKVHDNAPGQCKWIDAKQRSDTTFAKSAEAGNDRSWHSRPHGAVITKRNRGPRPVWRGFGQLHGWLEVAEPAGWRLTDR